MIHGIIHVSRVSNVMFSVVQPVLDNCVDSKATSHLHCDGYDIYTVM